MLSTRSGRLPTRSRLALTLCVLVSTLAATLAPASGASPASDGEDPPFVAWSARVPAIAFAYDPTSSDDCVAGRESCVRRTINEMDKRLAPLAASCDHAAVFSLAYLRTTETYLETAQTPGFYDDPRFVNHEDITFAVAYWSAFDDWAAGRLDEVPPAWRVAFAAARDRSVSGSGDLLLGISAHVNRDLPFVLAAIGLTAPDGSSRKGDHDQVNRMLNRVFPPLMKEQAARFDPTMASVEAPQQLGYTSLMQMLVAWREGAWRNAERLVAAPDAATQARVADSIEASAEATARSIVAATQYTPPLTSTAARDSYCASRNP